MSLSRSKFTSSWRAGRTGTGSCVEVLANLGFDDEAEPNVECCLFANHFLAAAVAELRDWLIIWRLSFGARAAFGGSEKEEPCLDLDCGLLTASRDETESEEKLGEATAIWLPVRSSSSSAQA